MVSKYGIFAVETKNYSGEIYGDDNRQLWKQMIATDVTYSAVNGTDSEAFKTTRDSDFVSRDFWYISGKKV